MNISRSTIKEFANLANEDKTKKETIVYGEIVEYNGRTYSRIDGSEELTPIASATNVKDGDRVIVNVKNHEATVMGNITNPAVGVFELDELGNLIVNTCVTFKGLEEGTTTINGACIKTGMIDAQYLNLTGQITFDDLSKETLDAVQQSKKQFSSNLTDWHNTMTSTDIYRRDWDYTKNDWGSPYQFVGKDGQDGADGSDATVPWYINTTIIGADGIVTPMIKANEFSIYPNSPTSTSGGFYIYGNYSGSQNMMFGVNYYASDQPLVNMSSDFGADLQIFMNTYINGNIQVSGSTTLRGITIINNNMYGTSLPTSPIEGQIFFLLES